jgi:hypothetical protein
MVKKTYKLSIAKGQLNINSKNIFKLILEDGINDSSCKLKPTEKCVSNKFSTGFYTAPITSSNAK